MVTTRLYTDALSGLCSKDQLELMDSIDRLRSQGISHYVSLPQIIVCGDQSSGKSSVLEAISGVSFPIKSNLCTRFPTELILRRAQRTSCSVSIVPHASRDELERKSLARFQGTLETFDGLSDLVEDAKSAMGISAHKAAFTKDLLRVEITGPDRPHLTIVDLPGLIHSETKSQTAADVKLISDVVKEYMREPRSVILAVVSAKNDLANQVVLKMARTVDASGKRTLGIITKPDTLTSGSLSEASFVSLARNEEVEFRLGWHVLKNMDSDQGVFNLKRRDEEEKAFFAGGVWHQLPDHLLGVDELRGRLSKVLLQQIATELPNVIAEIDTKTNSCQERLRKLGKPRTTKEDQSRYLVHASQRFQDLVKASVGGSYDDPFFGNPRTEQGYRQRIRAVIQNINSHFAEQLAKEGHLRDIDASEDDQTSPKDITESQTRTTRADFLDHIDKIMRRSKGRELPGTYNPLIVTYLFQEQCRPWEAILRNHVSTIWHAVRDFLILVAIHVTDEAAAKPLVQEIMEPALERLRGQLGAKALELLKPHSSGHPITYNDSFVEARQRIRASREEAEIRSIVSDGLKDFPIYDTFSSNGTSQRSEIVDSLVERLKAYRERENDRAAASDALDCMEAYYKIAIDRFVDDVAVELVETEVLDKLSGIFCPISVCEMAPELVGCIAGEPEENRGLREQLTKQLDVLAQGSQFCKRFVDVRLGVGRAPLQLTDENQDETTSKVLDVEPEPCVTDEASSERSSLDEIEPEPDVIEEAYPEDYDGAIAVPYVPEAEPEAVEMPIQDGEVAVFPEAEPVALEESPEEAFDSWHSPAVERGPTDFFGTTSAMDSKKKKKKSKKTYVGFSDEIVPDE